MIGSRATAVSREEYPARLFALPIATLFIWIAGVMLWGGAADPDQHFSLTQLAGTFLVFIAWSLCALSWGRVWSIVLGLEKYGPWSMAIAAGSASASWSGMLLGHLGLIGYSWFPLLFCLMFAGPLTCTFLMAKRGPAIAPLGLPCKGWEWLPFLVLGFVLVTWIASASLANGTTDPFFYHLLGPRQWVDAGRIEPQLGSASTFNCNYWEYIILWGMNIFGAPENKGLIEGQFFGQWLHLFFGSIGSTVILAAILENFSIRKIWIPAAIVAGLAAPGFRDYAALAKNDMGAASWCLAGTLLLCQFPKSRKDLALAGFFLGTGICAKIPTAVSGAGVVAAWSLATLLRERSAWIKRLPWVLLGSAAPFVPIALRNWYFSGDPAFPFFDPLFHTGWLSLTDTHTSAGVVGKLSTPLQWLRNILVPIRNTGWEWPLFLAAPFIPAARRKSPVAVVLMGTSLFALGAFAIKTYSELYVPVGFERWIGAGLLLVPCIAAAAGGDLADWAISRLTPTLQKFHAKPALVSGLVAFLFALPFAVSASKPWTFEAILEISPEAALRDMHINIGGATRAWLRLNTAHGDKIATTGEQLFYHVANLEMYSAIHYPPLEYSLDGVNRGDEALEILRDFGFKYLVDITHWETRFYGPFAAIFVRYAIDQHPEAIVYEDPQSLIVNLEEMENEATRSCVAPHGTEEDRFLRRFQYEHPSSFTFMTSNPWRLSLEDPIFQQQRAANQAASNRP